MFWLVSSIWSLMKQINSDNAFKLTRFIIFGLSYQPNVKKSFLCGERDVA